MCIIGYRLFEAWVRTVWSEGFLYKVAPPELKNYQLCILSSTIKWCYPKYWKLLCHKSKILKIQFLTLYNWLFRHRQTGVKTQNGTTIFNILDNTTELWMTKYIIGEIFSSGGATLYKNPSDHTVHIEILIA